MASYAPQAYWDELLGERSDERGVAYPHLARSFNRAMYRALLDATQRLLAGHGLLAPPPARVLDIGSGTGIWLDFWQRAGAREVVGLDLTQAAVDRLRARFPGCAVQRADVGAPALPVAGPFDAVSAMSVLLHVTDDARWRQALRNLAAVLAPGGWAVLLEPLVVHRWWGPPFGPEANSVARPRAQWDAALAAAGLELAALRPATVLLANAIDTRRRWTSRALWRYWDLLSRGIGPRERAGAAAGAVLGALDAPLRRRMPTGPSAKLLLLRRNETS